MSQKGANNYLLASKKLIFKIFAHEYLHHLQVHPMKHNTYTNITGPLAHKGLLSNSPRASAVACTNTPYPTGTLRGCTSSRACQKEKDLDLIVHVLVLESK